MRWFDPPAVKVSASVRSFVGGHPLIAELLARRGVTTVDAARAFLDVAAYVPAPPTDFPNLERAAERLELAIRRKEKICVWGDFDVDGQTSTSLLVESLRALGARVCYHIPVRAVESHGVRLPWIKDVLAQDVQLLVTCDTGVDAHEALNYAQSVGVPVIVTDHHELPQELPPAYAIINPHLLPAHHPLATLPGVGVVYELMAYLFRRAGLADEAARFLDLVALGIVADVAEQVADARYLLQRGLEVLRHTPRVGLLELARIAEIDLSQLTEENIAFGIAPRLNALGRLSDANSSVEFFTTADVTRARILASQLESLNARRRLLCDQVEQAALELIEKDPALLEHAALVLAHSDWPAGVIGIVASRLVERYDRPVLLLTTPPDGPAHGSARSVEGCHITAAIATQRDLLVGFGGHAMAAGVALPAEHIPAFRRGLSQAVAAQLAESTVVRGVQLDGYLPLGDLTLSLAEDLARLSPFGAGNPAPLLATRDLQIVGSPRKSRDGKHLWVVVRDPSGDEREVVWWQWNGAPLPPGRFDLAYSLGINVWRGERKLQITWQAFRQAETESVPLRPPLPEIVDYRREPHPRTLLRPLLVEAGVQVWREGPSAEVDGLLRHELTPTGTLVVWTAPPGPAEWQSVLARCAPQRVYLFGVQPTLDRPAAFLRYLAGLIKHALRVYEGRVDPAILAALTAQREATVRRGVEWLAARGYVQLLDASEHELRLRAGGQRDEAAAARLMEQVFYHLEETAAYRRYFRRAGAAVLCATPTLAAPGGVKSPPLAAG